ncbi:MAG: ABC transporter substrate-binding protein [Actinomycetota bacterium]|nr:ABC transporter substrate-binding protein [Actinomycetota bacterium]
MERVRLMCWCRESVGGMHLPAFAAAEAGLFAAQGIEVEFVEGDVSPDWSLRGLSQSVKALGAADADFALTSVAYLIAAQTDAGGHLPARFAAISHQRNPIVAVVREDSEFQEPADLPRARAAKWCFPWLTQEYVGTLARMGHGRATVVESAGSLDLETLGGMNRALRDGDVDVIPTWMEMSPYHREARHRDAGFPTRVIPLDIDVYTTGLLAADRLPADLIARVRDAFVAGYDVQREDPEPGIAAFRRGSPSISDEHIRINWALFEPNAFDGGRPGAMDAERWEQTIDYTAATHSLSGFAGEEIYRPELLAPALELAPA